MKAAAGCGRKVNRRESVMANKFMHCAMLLILTLLVSAPFARAQTATENRGKPPAGEPPFNFNAILAQARPSPRTGFSLMPKARLVAVAVTNSQVLGNGTIGRLTKWTGLSSSTWLIGDSTIFEDKFNHVGIGTDSPTAKMTVAGTIQS